MEFDGGRVMVFPFNEQPNTATISCRHILDECSPILYVSHDMDGMWQFLCGKFHDESDARIVSLHSIFMLDDSISQLASMPCGYVAERKNIDSNWIISKG